MNKASHVLRPLAIQYFLIISLLSSLCHHLRALVLSCDGAAFWHTNILSFGAARDGLSSA